MSRRRSLDFLLTLLLLIASFVSARADDGTGHEASNSKAARRAPRYEHREDHDPDGLGKFYMGREIAHVMGAGGIPWLERTEREKEEQLNRLIESLKLASGQVVAD